MKSCGTGTYAIVHYGEKGTALSPCYLRKPKDEFTPLECKFSFDIRNAMLSDNYPEMRNTCDAMNERLKSDGHGLAGHLMVTEIVIRRVELDGNGIPLFAPSEKN